MILVHHYWYIMVHLVRRNPSGSCTPNVEAGCRASPVAQIREEKCCHLVANLEAWKQRAWNFLCCGRNFVMFLVECQSRGFALSRRTRMKLRFPDFTHGYVILRFRYWVSPECVARVPVSLWGSGGWGCVRSTLRNQFATVRGRSREPGYGRAYGEFCNSGHFWRFPMPPSLVSRGRRGTLWHSNMFHNVSKEFKRRFFLWQAMHRHWGKLQNLSCFTVSKRVVMCFCVAGVALRDILMCLQTCRKSFCMAGTILLRRFQKMSCSFVAGCNTLRHPSSFRVAGTAL